jgi:hypothetical protein
MDPMGHMNIVMEAMISEYLEQIAEALELDVDELREEYIQKPKTNPSQCFLSRLENIKMKKSRKTQNTEAKCIARVYNSPNGETRGQCQCEQVDGQPFCKRHSKKRVHGAIIQPIILMKQHDFKKKEQYYPIIVGGLSYMYEPFSQKAIRVKDMKEFYIHSADGINTTISKRRMDNCVYMVRWNREKLKFFWNITTKEVLDIDTKEVIGSLDKYNKKWRLNINN